MTKNIKILGIAGSLRQHSYNRGLLRMAQQLVPKDSSLEIFDLDEIPLYNQDKEESLPLSVVDLKAKIRSADAILIATAEYNYSIPGILKNALDWASRPYNDNSWNKKPVAIMGASLGLQGTSRAQYHLRQVFVYLNMYPLNQPELMIGAAQDKFDKMGNVTDEKTKGKIAEQLITFVDWIKKHL